MSLKRLFNVLMLVIGLATLGGLIWEIGWDNVVKHLQSVGSWIPLLIFLYILSFAFDILAWRIAIGEGVSSLRLTGAAMAAVAINALTPLGEGGEVVKANLLSNYADGERVVSSVLIWNLCFRLTKHVTIFLGPILLLITGSSLFEYDQLLIFLGVSIVASIPTFLYFLALREGGALWTIRILRCIPFIRRRIGDEMVRKAKDTDKLVHQFWGIRKKDALIMLCLMMIARLVTALDLWVILIILGSEIGILEATFLFSAIFVVRVFLSIAPTAVGIGEGGETALFALFNLPVDIGFAQAFIKLMRSTFFNIFGLLYLAYETFRVRGNIG